MKTVKSYNDFLSENKDSNYYILFDNVVYVDNISRWGDEIMVLFLVIQNYFQKVDI